VLSAAVHFGLLAAMLVAFSFQQKFEDAQEAVPVETITDAQFSQVMKGVKTAKEATVKPRVDRVAEVADPRPTPPTPEAKRDVPAPPPPMKRQPDPSEAEDKPPTPTPPAPTPPIPPVRPLPPPPPVKAPPQEAREEPEKDDAEPVKPPPRPKPPEKTEAKPVPKPPEKPVEKPVEKPAPKETAKETPKPPKLDEVAKLLAENKDKPAPKPKSGEESAARPSPNLAEISRLLSREAPSSVGSAGRELSRTASLGAPNASAARMSPSMSGELNFLMQEQYKQCWNLPPTNGPRYVAKIHITYRPDGSLASQPVLSNPPSDPQSRALADSALRAVRQCNPLKIPARFQPYFEQWKDWVIGFDPDNM
jgi:colicin import membrane protein